MPAELEPIRRYAATQAWGVLCEGKSGEETVVRFSLPPGTDFPTLFRYFGDPAHPRGSSRNYYFTGQPLPHRCDERASVVLTLKLRGAPRIDGHLLGAGPPAQIGLLIETAIKCGFTKAASRAPTDTDVRPRPATWQADWLVIDANERTAARPGPLACFRHLSAESTDTAMTPVAAPTMPLAPAGEWISGHGDDLCTVQRRAVGNDGSHDFALRQHIGQSTLEVVLTRTDAAAGADRHGFGKVTLLPSQRVFDGGSESVTLDDQVRATRVTIDDAALQPIAASDGVVIDPGYDTVNWVSLNHMSSALDQLRACRDEALRGWGVDPARFRPAPRVGEPGYQNFASYFRSSDYPSDARRAFRSGRVVALVEVAPEGHAIGCRVIETSGVESLDAKTCQVARERFRFAPWRDARGSPATSWAMTTVHWIL